MEVFHCLSIGEKKDLQLQLSESEDLGIRYEDTRKLADWLYANMDDDSFFEMTERLRLYE